MVVPRKCLVTLDMGKALPIGQKIIEHDLDLHAPRHIFIMLYVLWDTKTNGSASFFHPYYDILPRTFQNIPIFWSEEELSWLEGSFLLQEIQNRTAAIEEDYYDVMEVAPELLRDCCDSIDDFKWARMVVTSRNFAFDMDGSRMSALVPHADMLNHRRPCETRWTFDDDLDGFTITTYVYCIVCAYSCVACTSTRRFVEMVPSNKHRSLISQRLADHIHVSLLLQTD